MDRFSNTQFLSAGFLMSVLQYAAYSLVPVPAVQVAAGILLKATSSMVFIMLNLKVVVSIVGEDKQITALTLVATFKRLFLCPVPNGRGTRFWSRCPMPTSTSF